LTVDQLDELTINIMNR